MKPRTAKDSGRNHENACVAIINERHGTDYERRRMKGAKDQGDLTTPFVTECKKAGALNIPQWLRELEEEIANAKAETGFIACRIKGRSATDIKSYYAVVPLDVHLDLLAKAGYLPERLP